MRKFIASFCLMAAAVTAAPAVHAGEYPEKTVSLVVPFAAGGPTDSAGRIMARAFERQTGKSFIVENIGGAGSTIGVARVGDAAPDGYSLLLATSSALVMAPHLYASLRYDTFKSFKPIGQVTEAPFILTVNTASPYKTYAEFLAYAKSNPGKLNYATPGLGTVQHLTVELMMDTGKFSAVHVPFKGAAPTITGLLGGEIDFIVETPNSVGPMIAAGKLRPLAVTSAKRAAALPDVPTLKELGYDVDTRSWFALMAPAGIPAPIVGKLEAMLKTALQDPETDKALKAAGFDAVPMTSDALSEMIAREYEKFGKIIKGKNIKLGMIPDREPGATVQLAAASLPPLLR